MNVNPTKWMLATVVLGAAACYVTPTGSQGQSSSSSSCNGANTTCPQVPPSYATDVSPVMFQYCTSCHGAGGSQSGKPLDSYGAVASLSSKVQSKLGDCSMPPSGNPQPSAAERDAVMGWLACGAPNN